MGIDETRHSAFRNAPFIAPWHRTREPRVGTLRGESRHPALAPAADTGGSRRSDRHAGGSCAGAAASTDLQAGEFVVTAEYKINLLRGARGEKLRCRAEVLKPGRRLAVVEAQVWSEGEGRSELVAKLNATMAVVTPR